MNIVVYVYNSFNDPLFSGNLMMFIRRSQQENQRRFVYHIITYEQPEYALSKEDRQKEISELEKLGIFWYPLRWHSGRLKMLMKAYDFLKGVLLITRLRFQKSAKWIITLGSVSGSFGFLISRLVGLSQYAYQFEPHSEFLLDMKQVKKHDLSFRLLNLLEKFTGKYAEIISTGTDAMVARLEQGGARGLLFKIPSAVDETRFYYDDGLRKKIREQLKAGDRRIFIYVGKTGGVYFSEELFLLFRSLRKNIPNSFFIVLTPQFNEYYKDKFRLYGIQPDSFFVSTSRHEDIPAYLSAADLGIVAIPPRPSQQYRSPIKAGEYLLCGLPFLTCTGVSEDYKIVLENKTGVVLADFTEDEVENNIRKIRDILNTERNVIARRCREAGISYRGFTQYYKTYSNILESMASDKNLLQ